MSVTSFSDNNNLEVVMGGSLPTKTILTYTTRLERSNGNTNMDVNGSNTPVDFFGGPSGSDVWFVTRVSLLLIDSGTMSPGDFGSINELNNGLGLYVDIDGTSHQLAGVHNNVDLLTEFADRSFTVPDDNAFFDEDDLIYVVLTFDNPLRLEGSNSDRIYFKVQDNLNSLTSLEASIKYSRIL